eukprot:TRINITY_DN69426_c0_g1_i1.p1 TRINITY_DN69426_c0_g1~~TRINITY_DN69426_c0_g1_i1.p1  ORF type:complete len:392 (-),score=54.53 TRINITY_DN69426_c0_g1_i1:90-1184(-)
MSASPAIGVLRAWAARVLESHALPPKDAFLVAKCLVDANTRGVDSHGLIRLPTYLQRLRSGYCNPVPTVTVRETSPCSALVDGDNGMGFVVCSRAMEVACDLSDRLGVGLVGVKRSTHFGASASYVMQALQRERISLVFTNSSPAQPPWGGSTALLGAAPFAAGAPSKRAAPFVIDMATTATARGKLRLAAQQGKRIPLGLALDKDGNPTDDGFKAFEGVVMPFGGHKGAGLALLMEILSGVVSGSAYGGDVKALYSDQTNAVSEGAQNVGHFVFAMRPDLFLGSMDEYYQRFDDLVDRIKANKPAEGFDAVLMPGEPESIMHETRMRDGLPMPDNVFFSLLEEGERIGVPLELRRTERGVLTL